jgi:thiol-disulfide isomerase/thioredoxin
MGSKSNTMELLLEHGVIKKSGEDHIQPTTDFADSVRRWSGEVRTDFESILDYGEELENHLERHDDLAVESVFATLPEFVPEISDAERHLSALLLGSLMNEMEKTAGVPDLFIPVSGEALPPLLTMYDRAIVYVWRHDCDPCDLVREDLEVLCTPSPEDVVLLAVDGPDSAEFLQKEYEVAGGPTVLFVKNGRVDARLLGAHSREALESFIDDLVGSSE